MKTRIDPDAQRKYNRVYKYLNLPSVKNSKDVLNTLGRLELEVSAVVLGEKDRFKPIKTLDDGVLGLHVSKSIGRDVSHYFAFFVFSFYDHPFGYKTQIMPTGKSEE